MATELIFTDTANTPITTINFGNLDRTVATATQTVRLWNDHDGSLPGAERVTARALVLFPLYRMAATDPFLASGVEPAESQWLWARLNGNIQNPEGGTTGDHAAVPTGWFPVGGRAVFMIPNIPWHFARELQFYMYAPGSGSTTSVNAMKIAIGWDRNVITLDAYSRDREGDATQFRGDSSSYELVCGVKECTATNAYDIGGCEVKNGAAAPNESIRVEPGFFKLGGVWGKTPLWESAVITNLDGSAVALGAGERYALLLTKDSTGFTSADFTLTKGDKALAGNETLPAPPAADDIVIGSFSRIADADGGGLTSFVQFARHDGARVMFDGSGEDIALGMYTQTQSGAVQREDGDTSPAYPAGAGTKYIIVDAQNNRTGQATAPTAHQRPCGRAVSDGTNTTLVTNTQLYREPNLYRALRHTETRVADGRLATLNNELFLFGYLDHHLGGTVDNTSPAANHLDMLNATGHRIAVRITEFTTLGDMRFEGVRINGSGTETGGVTEDHLINKVGMWVWSATRWGSAGAMTPDVIIHRPAGGTLDVVAQAYVGNLWQCQAGKPFHVAALELNIEPLTILGRCRARLYKVNEVDQPIVLQVVNFANLGTDTVTLYSDYTTAAAQVCTEDGVGVPPNWLGPLAGSNAACATSLAAAIDSVTGFEAYSSGDYVYVRVTDVGDIYAVSSDAVNLVVTDHPGAFTRIFDTGLLSGFTGSGGAGAAPVYEDTYRWLDTIPLRYAGGSTELADTSTQATAPHGALVQPWKGGDGPDVTDGGEGIFLYISDIQDIGRIEATLHYYPLLIP